MSPTIAESDWKKFRELHAVALERYFQHAIAEISRAVLAKDKPNRDVYWNTAELIERQRKELAWLFDDFRRSTALIQLAMIRAHDLITDEEMSRFSPLTREAVQMYLGIGKNGGVHLPS